MESCIESPRCLGRDPLGFITGLSRTYGDVAGGFEVHLSEGYTHVDVLTRHCDVWIDDEQVIAGGQYLLEKFGWS